MRSNSAILNGLSLKPLPSAKIQRCFRFDEFTADADEFSVTADFIYIRFHGLAGGPRHDYDAEGVGTMGAAYPKAGHGRQKVFAYLITI